MDDHSDSDRELRSNLRPDWLLLLLLRAVCCHQGEPWQAVAMASPCRLQRLGYGYGPGDERQASQAFNDYCSSGQIWACSLHEATSPNDGRTLSQVIMEVGTEMAE